MKLILRAMPFNIYICNCISCQSDGSYRYVQYYSDIGMYIVNSRFSDYEEMVKDSSRWLLRSLRDL